MSYILDALRRADAERERGAVPSLHAQQFGTLPNDEEEPGWRTRKSSWAIVGLTLALVAALAWNLLARAPAPVATTAAAPGPIAGSVPTPPPAAVPPPTLPAVTASAPPATRVPAPVAPSAESRPARQRTPPRDAEQAASGRATAKEPGTADRRPRREATGRSGAAGTTASDQRGAERTASGSSVDASGPRSPTSPAAGATTGGGGESRVVTLRELPEDVRRGLPTLTISGSTYSSDKASRMVMINGQIFREGDPLPGGVVLQQIKPRAAIFAVKNHRYEVTF